MCIRSTKIIYCHYTSPKFAESIRQILLFCREVRIGCPDVLRSVDGNLPLSKAGQLVQLCSVYNQIKVPLTKITPDIQMTMVLTKNSAIDSQLIVVQTAS